jgi:hypothetical protein
MCAAAVVQQPGLTFVLRCKCLRLCCTTDDVVTAAHCVVNSVTGVSFTPGQIVPGKDGDREPYGRYVFNGIRGCFCNGSASACKISRCLRGQHLPLPGHIQLDRVKLNAPPLVHARHVHGIYDTLHSQAVAEAQTKVETADLVLSGGATCSL